MVAQSEIFSKGKAEDFNKILKRQKKDESDPKFAISDSLQEYQQQLEASAGYQNQMKLNKANIRQDIVNFVIDYTVGDLDQLKCEYVALYPSPWTLKNLKKHIVK